MVQPSIPPLPPSPQQTQQVHDISYLLYGRCRPFSAHLLLLLRQPNWNREAAAR
jgi:hypothetical protein